MKIKQIIYIAALGLMTACSNDITSPTNTVGEADNAIVLRAGISDGGTGVMTRAAEYGEHSKHVGFTANTQIALRIDGTWTGHSPADVKTKTIATLGAASDKHNPLSTYSPNVYWDDYGTADPANATTGRTQGLTVYGAAVDGKTSLPTTLSSLDNTASTWQSLAWSVGTPADDKISQTAGWGDYDLVTSNNVTSANNNTYKFAQKNDGKLLEFTHAMTKITVNLTAGAGFPGYATNPATAKFEKSLSVTLLNFNYTGTVNVETKTSTPTDDTKTNIQMHLAEGGVNNHTAKYDALVFPGNTITNTATDYVLELNADGNVYQVNGTKLYAKMTELSHDYVLKQGVNYIINVTVNKTGIDVTATIKDWETVNSAEEAPIININKCYGQEGTNFGKGFTFYRSTAIDGSYLDANNNATISYADSKYTMTPQLFWPDHSTHYFFRGIWPLVGSDTQTEINQGYTPVAKITHNSETTIDVENVSYTAYTYPTDLMIGMPRKEDGTSDEQCKAGHTEADGTTPKAGICATDAVSGSHPYEGLIHMNFQYAMSQVIVKLQTSSEESSDKVTFDNHTTVEIVDCYNSGKIKLSNGSSDFTGKTVTNFTMKNDNSISNPEANDYANYRNVIIPQSLTNGTGTEAKDLKFRISVGDGTTTDIYETVLGIKNIKVTEGGSQKNITAWEPGKIYIYTLKITKTDIIVTATLKDWITVTADEPIWF